jgi:glycerol-3-phosphate acyltransferase PlsX
MIVKRIKGVRRVAFAPVIPKRDGFFMLIDSGANNECTPPMLRQFALMGSAYMEKVMGVKNPRVGLVNVGTEEHKGPESLREAYHLLQGSGLNFVGNVEAREIPGDGADVIVCDGFTGNVILKLYEGVALTLMGKIKGVFMRGLRTKIAAALVLKDMKQLKREIDYDEYGGAPVMGARRPVFKIHGSARAKTVKNALRLTMAYVEGDVVERIAQAVSRESENEEVV